MSETKHTPGPWGSWHQHIYAGPFDVIPGGIKGYRAEICSLEDMDVTKSELAANARLIAAAPDLLSALIGFINEFGDKATNANVTKARAAIAKAQGHAHD